MLRANRTYSCNGQPCDKRSGSIILSNWSAHHQHSPRNACALACPTRHARVSLASERARRGRWMVVLVVTCGVTYHVLYDQEAKAVAKYKATAQVYHRPTPPALSHCGTIVTRSTNPE